MNMREVAVEEVKRKIGEETRTRGIEMKVKEKAHPNLKRFSLRTTRVLRNPNYESVSSQSSISSTMDSP